jgi:heterodisulfide reductase subunit A-like polyferredoxin
MKDKKVDKKVGAVLVIGGGIGGMQASLDVVDSGFKVYLLEKKPNIGGVMAQLDKTFPTNDCSMCIMAPKLVEVGRNPNIELITWAELDKVEGEAGNFTATIRKHPRYIDPDKCTGCGLCAQICPVELIDEYNEGLTFNNAISILYPQGVPADYVINRETPQCQGTCPVNTDVRKYVNLIADGRFKEAIETVREKNPFPSVCGRICHHPCEEMCKRGYVDEPLAIRPLKRFVADLELSTGIEVKKPEKEKNDKVAIIGSGPGGLTAAYDLAKMGYRVTVFEKLPVKGGMLRSCLPDYRLPKDVLDKEIEAIERTGVEIKTNSEIKDIGKLKKDGFKAILISVGLQKGKKLPIPGADFKGVLIGIPFLMALNEGKNPKIGKKVLVIGGGNVAIDVARSCVRLGAREVRVACLESREEMPAHEWEVKEALEEGIKLHCRMGPSKILGKNGKVSGIECIEVESVFDKQGRFNPVYYEGSEFLLDYDCDTIMIAIGQDADLLLIKGKKNIKITRGGTIIVDPLTLATDEEGVFAAGDIVNGPASAIEAIGTGHQAAISIARYLKGEDMKKNRTLLIETKPERYLEEELARKELEKKLRTNMEKIPLKERMASFKEIEIGYTEEMAVAEAKRCLSCRKCLGCGLCEEVCEADAIRYDQVEELSEIDIGAIILSPGFDEFDPKVISEYGYSRFDNVVTSIEFERILSASGPYSGTVLRPGDGKVPEKIAWIQCVGSRDEVCGNGYCSSVCCTYAVKEAVIAKEHVGEFLSQTIFYMDMRTYGKDFDKYQKRAEDEYGVKFVRAKVSSIEEVPETKNLIVTYESDIGEIEHEEFALVVLSVGFNPPDGARALASKLGIQLNNYGYCDTNRLNPVQTSKDGIFVCGAFGGPKDIPETVMQASGAAAKAEALLSPVRNTLVKVKEYPPEIDVEGQEPRIGAFICHCGINIGGFVDVPSVVEYAKTLPNVVHAEDNLFTCSDDTQRKIKEAIKEYKLNRVVVASCTPRTHEPLFQETIREAGLNKHLFEMANIRDQCSWIHMHQPQEATAKAKDLVRMAIAKARLIEPLPSLPLDVTQKGLVIGGGLAGMVAALGIANQGYEVYLIEREKDLGGMLSNVYYTLEGEDVQEYLKSLIKKVEDNPLIHIYENAYIKKIEGFVGNYKTEIGTKNSESSTLNLEHGIIIVATGGRYYEPNEYLYGKNKNVITQSELEKIIYKSQEISDLNSIVMIQCVGSRDDKHPYCSRVCCSQAIKNALKIKKKNPNINIYILYRDIRTYGFREEYYRKAREMGITFIRYDEYNKPELIPQRDNLKVSVKDPLLGYQLILDADLLVLSVGFVPQPDCEQVAEMLKIPLNDEKFFLEAHVKLRPVEFATEGVFLAGLAHSPKSIDETIAQAKGAASRACTIISKDKYMAEPTIAVVNDDICDGCGICEPVCEYGAIEIVTEKMDGNEEIKKAKLTEALCKGCGACIAACPSGAMEQKGFKTEQMLAMIDAALEGVTGDF